MDPKKDKTETEATPAPAPEKPTTRRGRPPKKKAEVEAKPKPKMPTEEVVTEWKIGAKTVEPEPIPSPPPVTFAANTKLQVTPTQAGISMMQEKHDAMLHKVGSAVRGAYPRNVLEFRACSEPGCVTYTLLEILEQFGPDVALGKALPFEEEGLVVVEDDK